MSKKLIRLTESDLHRIVKESVNRILKEGLYDTDEDNEIYDVGYEDKYRVVWEFKTKTSYLQYKTISEGEKIVDSEDNAYKLFNNLSRKYKGAFATKFRIERLVKSLSDNRWENVYDASNNYVSPQ